MRSKTKPKINNGFDIKNTTEYNTFDTALCAPSAKLAGSSQREVRSINSNQKQL